jgi:hypothetical protein
MKKFKDRMKLPLSAFKRDDIDVVVGAAKRCLNTAEGDILLKHLISEYELDAPTGCLEGNDLTYKTACQDVVKHIISLTNDT